MEEKDYITQITKQDLREIAKATKPKPGFLVRITDTPGELVIEVDENAFKTAVFGFLHNLGAIPGVVQPTQQQISETSCVPG